MMILTTIPMTASRYKERVLLCTLDSWARVTAKSTHAPIGQFAKMAKGALIMRTLNSSMIRRRVLEMYISVYKITGYVVIVWFTATAITRVDM